MHTGCHLGFDYGHSIKNIAFKPAKILKSGINLAWALDYANCISNKG